MCLRFLCVNSKWEDKPKLSSIRWTVSLLAHRDYISQSGFCSHCLFQPLFWLMDLSLLDGLLIPPFIAKVCAKHILFSRKSNPPGEGLVYIKNKEQHGKSTFWESSTRFSFQAVDKAKAIKHIKFTEACTMELTQHCCARGLRKQWNKQEVDEVDEGQAIVPEEAGCRHRRSQKKSRINSKSIKKQRQAKASFQINPATSSTLCGCYITFNN